MKDVSNLPTGEAEAYLRGYADGWKEARKMLQPLKPDGRGLPACEDKNSDVMCDDCNCWKITRAYSS